MPRLKITEYRAKKLILGESYAGFQMKSQKKASLPKTGRFVFKVDQGVKKRFTQGLVALDQSPKAIPKLMAGWAKRGFDQFLVEPYFTHKAEDERYLSLERVREGIRVLFSRSGGIATESHAGEVKTFIVAEPRDIAKISKATDIPPAFLEHLFSVFEKRYFAFCEINPLVVQEGEVHLLDAAVLVDSAGSFFTSESWTAEDVVVSASTYPVEERVSTLAKTTPASLKLTVLHPNGGLFFLLSGGGGSIVIADQAALRGAEKEIGNYGEYSGGPTREETHLYAREVVDLLLRSTSKKKALVIAGGVANFTDVLSTFHGIIDALSERLPELCKAKVKVFVRRGGPNEAAGLAYMEAFLKKEGLLGSVYGSEAVITQAVDDALSYIGK